MEKIKNFLIILRTPTLPRTTRREDSHELSGAVDETVGDDGLVVNRQGGGSLGD